MKIEKKYKKNLIQKIFNFSNGISSQDSLGISTIFEDGTIKSQANIYSRIIEFEDISYRLASNEEKNKILNKYLAFINSFDSSTYIQYSFINEVDKNDTIYNSVIIDEKEDNYSKYRKELNQILKDRIDNSNSNLIKRKFITFSIIENNPKNIKNRLNQIEQSIKTQFKQLKVLNTRLERLDVINLFNNILNNDYIEENQLNEQLKQGLRIKDIIAPSYINFKSSVLTEINDIKYKTFYLNINSTEISDELLSSILDTDDNIVATLSFEKLPLQEAIKSTQRVNTDINAEIIKGQKQASTAGYDPTIISPTLADYRDEVQDLLEDLQKNNENYFLITILLTIKAESEEKIENLEKLLQSEMSKHIAEFRTIKNQNEEVLKTILPTANNYLSLERGMTTKNIATMIPFTTQELIMNTKDSISYGINSLSKNIIMLDRKSLKNPAGLILGTPGSGKSFTAKIEALSTFLTTDDDMLIIDPESEYIELAKELEGEVIEISPSSKTFINPFDIAIDVNSTDEDFRKDKTLFIISMIEILVGGINGLDGSQISLIDRVCTKIYDEFYKEPSVNNMPTFQTFYDELLNQSFEKGDTASDLAEKLEIYVTGSMNIFNNKTNINISNRLTVFDINGLSGVLNEIGMFIIQNYIWSRTLSNFNKNKWTRVYIDEFHRILRTEKSAEYMKDMFKTFRKRGGILTGVTQNVSDFLDSPVSEAILKNASFAILLNQTTSDAQILSQVLDINEEQLFYVENVDAGEGLIVFEGVVLPFKNKISDNTTIYKVITTKFSDKG